MNSIPCVNNGVLHCVNNGVLLYVNNGVFLSHIHTDVCTYGEHVLVLWPSIGEVRWSYIGAVSMSL